jgi:pyruvate,orthophosphate dikinase
VGEHLIRKGAWITVDGSTGQVYAGKIPTTEPAFHEDTSRLLAWADERRRLRVRANADTGSDAQMARSFGEERLSSMRQMILAENWAERVQALEKILHAKSLSHVAQLTAEISQRETLLRQVDRLREVNPMLGHRGCRLSIQR